VTVTAAVIVFLAALATALATGLGALPFAIGRRSARGWLGPANAIASGVMLGASTSLLSEGATRSEMRTVLGVVAGALLVAVAHRAATGSRELTLGALSGADARRALLVVGVMTVHSIAEGVGVGAAFGGGDGFGLLIAVAIAVHNIPEGLAISLVLVPRGTRVLTAAGWSVFSSLPQPVLAVPAFAFVETSRSLLPLGLGFAAGAMIWLVLRELLPEALEQTSRRVVATAVATAFAVMLAFQMLLL
jgi:ZIP family zinc transporter